MVKVPVTTELAAIKVLKAEGFRQAGAAFRYCRRWQVPRICCLYHIDAQNVAQTDTPVIEMHKPRAEGQFQTRVGAGLPGGVLINNSAAGCGWLND